ncbi:transglycosylase SLT domain-containing protein, partial [Acetobacter nitrogenifigens]|uniref:transglycosylase SLT domain-containing protein n=3 Tax=Acetobacter nitrogenifigens TaxID=285268 RepID=UPI00222F5F8C
MATRVSELIARLNDQVSAQARTVAENLNKVSTSGKDVQSAMDGVDGSMKRTAQTTDQFVRSADGVQKATNRIEAAFDRTAMRLERATEDYRKGAITLQQYRDIQATLATQYENIETREQKTIDALRRKGEALAQVTGATHDASEATDAASAGLDNLTAAQGKNTATVKLQSYQIAQIADEFHKWVDQVLSGGSAITATTYQLPNMVQAMGGLGNATKLVGGLLSGPAGLGLAATIAGVAIYKLGSYAEGEQEHMAQLSQHLRATRTDYADLAATAEHAARSLHGGSDLSLADSRTIIQTIVSVPTVDNTQLQRLTHDAQDLATVMGTTVPDAAKTLASSMQDPSKAAQQFSEESLTGFDAALVQSVQHMQQMGDRAGATDLVLRTLEQTVHGATDNALTPFQAAWRKLEDEFGVVHDVATTKAQGIGDVIVGMATTSIGAITDLVEEIRKIPGAMETAWGAVKSGAGWAYGKLESGVEALVPQELADSMRRGNAPDPVFASPAGRASSSGSDSWNFRQASSMVDTVAAEQALGSDLTSLMHLIQSAESSTGQYHNGQLVTSGAGAIGAMQVMPSNAGGYDITDLHGNESASAKYLKQLYAKYDGDQTLVAMAYNWGPGNVDRWLAQGSNPDTIPQETQDYIARTTEGRVYGSVAAAGLRQSSDAYVSKGDPGTAGQLADLQRTYAGESQALSDLNRQFQAGLIGQQAYETGAKDLHAQMDATSASIANTRDPLQELSHSLDLSAQSAAGLTGYQREMISVAQQVDQAQLSMNGAHASASSVLAAQTQAQARLGNEWTASVTALSRQADEQDSVNASYAETAQSLDHVTNYQKAYEAALNSFDQKSPDFSKHVDDMTAALDRQTAAQKEQQLIGQIWSNNDQLAILQAETASLGQNDDARQAMTAHMQAEQTLLRNGESLTDRTSQAYLASADAVTQASVAYEHQQQTLSDLTGSISNMADQLSDGLVQGFLQGTSSGMSFRSTLQAIETQIASMILKMGLINPLLNDIDGGTRDTLSDVSKLLGNLGGSSGSSSGDGWGSTGGAMDFEGSGISVGQELNLKNSLSSPASATSGSWLQSALGTKVIGSASIGNMLAGLGGGMAVGGLVGSLTGGGSGSTIGGSIGSLVGSVGGSFLGPIGSMVGGTVLGGIGSLIGSLFSKSHYAYDSVSGQGGQLVISDRRVKRSDDDVSGSLQSALDAINAVY